MGVAKGLFVGSLGFAALSCGDGLSESRSLRAAATAIGHRLMEKTPAVAARLRDEVNAHSSSGQERHLVIAAAHVAVESGRIRADEAEGLIPALEAGYERMAAEDATWTLVSAEIGGVTGSLMSIPQVGESPRLGVVFLHGYGGRFAIQCWHVAYAFERGHCDY